MATRSPGGRVAVAWTHLPSPPRLHRSPRPTPQHARFRWRAYSDRTRSEAAGVRTLRSPEPVARRAHRPRPDPRRAARPRVRRLERVPRAQDRPHGLGLDSDRGALGGVLPDAGPLDDPREQHRADHRLRRRVDRGGHRLHAAGDPADGLRPERRQGGDRGGGGRRDGHPAHDPAPARAHREGARPSHLPRGHRLRRGAGRGREGRPPGPPAVPGVRHRLRLQVPDVGAQGLEGVPGLGVDRLQGRLDLGGGLARAAGRGLHHRAAHRGLSLLRRLPRLPRADPGHQAVRQRPHLADLRRDQADRRHEPGRGPRQLRVLHRRRRGGLGRHHRPGPRAADDHRGVPLRLPGPARQHRRDRDAAPDRPRPAGVGHAGRRRGAGAAAHRAAAARRQPARRRAHRGVRLLLRGRVVAHHRRDRRQRQSGLGDDDRRADRDDGDLPADRLDRRRSPGRARSRSRA